MMRAATERGLNAANDQPPKDLTIEVDFKLEQKQSATLVARAALVGITLNQTGDGHGNTGFIVSRCALTRRLDNLEAVACWLDCVTGDRHG